MEPAALLQEQPGEVQERREGRSSVDEALEAQDTRTQGFLLL